MRIRMCEKMLAYVHEYVHMCKGETILCIV
jgi:hypothetical protein